MPAMQKKAAVGTELLSEVLYRKFKEAREDAEERPPVGEHSVRGRATLDVDCTVDVLDNTNEAQRHKPELIAVLAAFAAQGPQWSCEQAATAAAKAIKDAAAGKVRKDFLEHIASAVTEAIKGLSAKLRRKPKAGAVKVAGSVEIVDFVGLPSP